MNEEFKEINSKIMVYALKNKGYHNLPRPLQGQIYEWYERMCHATYNEETLQLGKSIIKGIV